MNDEIDIIHIGAQDDIDIGSVENFEHDEKDYAIFHLDSGFFATQGHCNCIDQAFLSDGNVEGEEVECTSCGDVYSIVSGDPINDEELLPLKIYDVLQDGENIYLNL